MAAPPPKPLAHIDRALVFFARLGARRPYRVLLGTLLVLLLSFGAASRLEFREDFIELLPSESVGARLLRHAMARMGGGSATMFVVVDSPDAEANRRLVDALEVQLRALPPTLVRTVEHGPEEIRRFFWQRRWLYAEVGDLEEISCELQRTRRRAQPGYVDLDDEPCSALRSDHDRPAAAPSTTAAAAPAEPEPAHVSEAARPFHHFRAQLRTRTREVDQYPTGYFRNPEGTLYAIVLRSPATGTGDSTGDQLMTRVNRIVRDVHPERFHPRAQVGLGGDIPSAVAERDALKEEAIKTSGLAVVLILGVIVLFFRSLSSLAHIGLAMITGVGLAFAVAYFAFGYLNASTAFLGSIIAGNGINYGIIYLARYRDRRALGDSVEDALVDAAVTCRRGTQLAALAAAFAYGSLMLTSFRGFSQFGLIGGVGMIFCWCATMVVVPATVTAVERLRARLFPARAARLSSGATRTPISGFIAVITSRYPKQILAVGAVLCVWSAVALPKYLRDPWEYNFANLGSRGSRHTGADAWSSRADRIFVGRGGSPDILLADRFEDVLELSAALLHRDQERTGGRFIDHIETAWDRLGGQPAAMTRKLEILQTIRADIDAILPELSGDDLALAREWRPPADLRAPQPDELPALVRAQFTEKSGRFGTPVFVYYKPWFSPSDGRKLIIVADLTQNVRLADGRTVPTVSRSTVFAEMVRAMSTDGPRATFAAFMVVVFHSLLATRRLGPAAMVLGALLSGVLFTVGGAAHLGVRLNFLNFVALPLTFGIGVEYAMNLYDRVEHLDDVGEGIRSVGGAVTLCSMTTIIGYGSLLVADNQALQSFGYLAVAGELSCILTAMLLLPSALVLARRRRGRAS
ncbi:MAG: exporters of the superfamily [Myxococcaceae bacterium]|nr:exporters of the superfamily [Myxococcaceae bacterium]